MNDLNVIKLTLNIFSKPFKRVIIILTSIHIIGCTYAIYIVGGDWIGILILSVFGIGLTALAIITGIRCGKNILTDKEKSDIAILENCKITKIISTRFFANADLPIILRFITIMGNSTRWAFFLTFLLGVVALFIIEGINGAFFGFCFLAALWLPFLDNLLFSKLNYIVIVIGKLLITIAVIALFTAISL